MSQVLFDGEIIDGKLSNLEDLLQVIPEEFHRGNIWFNHVERLLMRGGSALVRNWNWDPVYISTTQTHMDATFRTVLGAREIAPKKRIALCSWMLSVMLIEVPPDRGALMSCS